MSKFTNLVGKTREQIYASVEKSSAKYIYFTNGETMHKKDFNQFMLQLRREQVEAQVPQSLENRVAALEEMTKLIFNSLSSPNAIVETPNGPTQQELYELEASYVEQEYIDWCNNRPTIEDYQKRYEDSKEEVSKLKRKLRDTAKAVYTDIDWTTISIDTPIKFIIQKNNVSKEYRLRCDPYQFVENWHSNLSDLFSEQDWGTENGGWIVMKDGVVVLYKKSGDYGIYDDVIGSSCAHKLFNKFVLSFAGKELDDINLVAYMYKEEL